MVWTKESGRHSLARQGISTTTPTTKPTMPGKIFDITTAPDALNKLKNGIDAPYVNVYSSNLGGDENVSILITASLEPKEKWEYNILENSPYAKYHLHNDGRLENFSGELISADVAHKAFVAGKKVRNTFRKRRVISVDEAITDINIHLNKARFKKDWVGE
jgi:hypothetical protein